MHSLLQFGLLASITILRVDSFGTTTPTPTPTSSPRGLSYDAIAELARKRYPTNRNIDNHNHNHNDDDGHPPMKGRVAVITGAAGGIGGELSKTVHRLGGTVVALDRNAAGLEELQKTLVANRFDGNSDNNNNNDDDSSASDDAHNRIFIIPTNHEDLSSVASTADLIISRFGDQIDLLVNNAGMSYRLDQPADNVMISAHGKDLAFTVNYLSHFLLTEKLMQSLSNGNGGRVVHVTSTYHWKEDGSELLPSPEDGIPIAYQSDPKKQHPNHLKRCYANTKLAQIWHSRSIAGVFSSNNSGSGSGSCSSVCACPLWAATGIAGENSRDFLDKYAFSISDCGPGITSSINAILRTDDELGDALDDGKSFVANARILEYLKGRTLLASEFVTKTLGWRDDLTDLMSLILLFGQKYTHEDFIIQQTSPESFDDKQKRDQFYQWSKEEVKPWL